MTNDRLRRLQELETVLHAVRFRYTCFEFTA